jgi:hypothetical protein
MYSRRNPMSEVQRISVDEARQKVQSGSALLVCAYDNDEKFQKLKLEGALSLSEFRSRLSTLPKDGEIIFYCA